MNQSSVTISENTGFGNGTVSVGCVSHDCSEICIKRPRKFLRTVRTLRGTGSCTRFVERVGVIATGIALPNLDWAVQGVIVSCSGCLFSGVTPRNSVSILCKINVWLLKGVVISVFYDTTENGRSMTINTYLMHTCCEHCSGKNW